MAFIVYKIWTKLTIFQSSNFSLLIYRLIYRFGMRKRRLKFRLLSPRSYILVAVCSKFVKNYHNCCQTFERVHLEGEIWQSTWVIILWTSLTNNTYVDFRAPLTTLIWQVTWDILYVFQIDRLAETFCTVAASGGMVTERVIAAKLFASVTIFDHVRTMCKTLSYFESTFANLYRLEEHVRGHIQH